MDIHNTFQIVQHTSIVYDGAYGRTKEVVWIWAASGSALRRQRIIKSAPQARPDSGIFDKNDEGMMMV